jgi:membrane protein YqaA with SNARE-associated domain
VKLLLTVLAVSFVSALVPLVNAEAFLAWVAGLDDLPLVLAAATASIGQVAGKLVWYYGGMHSLDIGWVQRRLEKARREETLAKWQKQTQGRPAAAGALCFSAAFLGLPPYLAVAAVAGLLGVGIKLFVVTGLVGRFLRFWLVLELAAWSWLLL